MTKVAYCQVSFSQDFGDTLENVIAAKGHVDSIIVVEDGSFTDEQVAAFRAEGATLRHQPWNDDFPAYRNASLDEARNQKADWVLVSDADEHFNAELFADLKTKVIPALEAQGFNTAGVRCNEQFDSVEWLDDLDLMKESPGGYRQSTFYKQLLFTLYPDMNYEGVGYGTVHEVWGSKSVRWKATNLPDPYAYTHRKSALRIWRNAARNLVMGGGGDTVGPINKMWTELRDVMEKMGLENWDQLEGFVMSGEPVPLELAAWVERALVWSASDYGTETRETAKWIVWHHRELLGVESIAYGVAHPPAMTEDEKLEMEIRKTYFLVLHRHPDREGLDNYIKRVKEGKLKLGDLQRALEESDEYKAKFPKQADMERVRAQIPISVDVGLSPEALTTLIATSKTFQEKLKPKFDIGGAMVELYGEEFVKKFYQLRNENRLTRESMLKLLTGVTPDQLQQLMGMVTRGPRVVPSVDNPGT
jgi:glycosyltransferase involved in cell wall biosynthesis